MCVWVALFPTRSLSLSPSLSLSQCARIPDVFSQQHWICLAFDPEKGWRHACHTENVEYYRFTNICTNYFLLHLKPTSQADACMFGNKRGRPLLR